MLKKIYSLKMKKLVILEKPNCPLCVLFSSNNLLSVKSALESESVELETYHYISGMNIPEWCREFTSKKFPVILYKEENKLPVWFSGNVLDTAELVSWIRALTYVELVPTLIAVPFGVKVAEKAITML